MLHSHAERGNESSSLIYSSNRFPRFASERRCQRGPKETIPGLYNWFPRSAWERRLRRSASTSRTKNDDTWDAAVIGSENQVSRTS